MRDGVTVIVPFLNEGKEIYDFCKQLDEYAKTVSFPLEAIFVNDGSEDCSGEVVAGFSFEHVERCRQIEFSKNYGSHAAIRAGVQRASYDVCTWIAADGQDPLELIDISYKKIRGEGYDAVYVGRTSMPVPIITKFFSKIYSRLMKKYAVKRYEPDGFQTIVFNRKIMDYLNSDMEANSSVVLQIVDAGFKTDTIKLDFKSRAAGRSKWTFSKKLKLAIDSFVAFSFMPIRLVSIVGVLLFLAGLVFGIWVIINRFTNPSVPLGYSTLVCILLAGFGITNISLGIMAEYLWRTYDAARNRSLFLISSDKELKQGNDNESNKENE